MAEFYVKLHSVDDVKLFVSAATLRPCDIDVVSGRYTVDAKSIMGLFSLDLTQPVKIMVYGEAEDGAAFRAAVESLVVPTPARP